MGTSIPTLMLERCAQAIEKTIIPNLPNDFAARQAGLIAALLHALAPTLEEKGDELIKENKKMRDVLRKVMEALRGEKVLYSKPVATEIMLGINRALQNVETGSLGIREGNDCLKEALVETIKRLDALEDDLMKETISSLRQQIRSVVRQQLDHELARVSHLEIIKVFAGK
jgi:hypothetical protein